MTGQLCGSCGEALAPDGCACRRAEWAGHGDEETAVIPVVGGPELVRPYFQPADGQGTEQEPMDVEVVDAELLDAGVLDAEVLDSSPAAYAGYPARPPAPQQTRVLPVHLPAHLPAQRSAESLGSLVVTPGRDGAGSGGRRRRAKPSRSAVLVGAGIAAIAGLGVAAALVPRMLGGGPVNVALPQPGVTAPLPTQSTDSPDPSASASATQTQAAPATPTSQPARPTASATATRAAAQPSTSPASTSPSASTSSPSASGSGSPTATATAGSSATAATLSLGDTGPAVVTLQQELSALYVDADLPANGSYGRRTEEDVATFQFWYGVQGDPSGVFGPNSQAEMAELMNQQNGGNDGGGNGNGGW